MRSERTANVQFPLFRLPGIGPGSRPVRNSLSPSSIVTHLLAIALLGLVVGCKSKTVPPSGGMPSPSSSMPGMPGSSSPGTPGPPGGSSPGQPSPSGGGSPGSASPPGGSAPGMPGPSGTPGVPSSGSGTPSSYENLPGGVPSMPGGGPSGDGGESGEESGTAGSDMPSWIPGSGSPAGAGEEEWETSNELPGTANVPPRPGEESGAAGEPGLGGGMGGELDGELDAALEDFDGGILAEREIIRERSNETAGQGSALPLPSVDEGPGGGGNDSAADNPGGPTGVPRARNAPPAPVAGVGQIPDDIPDAKDDDIIARQLREAAMQETDPDLKEKLWNEYRRYNGA